MPSLWFSLAVDVA